MISRARCLSVLLTALLGVVLLGSAQAQQPLVTQVIDLSPGWNLISVQVGTTPISAANFRAALDHPEFLIEVWGYNATGNPSTPGSWNSYQPLIVNFPIDLAAIEQGRGYWVNVSQFCQATITAAPWTGNVSFVTGWNLVGFPGATFASFEAQDIVSIFATKLSQITQVWGFKPGAGASFVGYDTTAIPAVKDLTSVQPGRGYWVYATGPLTLQPQPFVALVADADASPLESEILFSAGNSHWHGTNPAKYVNTFVRFADPEDVAYDLNGNGVIDTPTTQDTIRFEVGVDRKTISIGNTGESIVSWALVNTVPWLFAAPANSNDPTNAQRAKTASGTVSSDVDTVTLYVDRTGLRPGSITGQTVTIYAGGTVHVISIILDVPTASGDWKGYASAAKVNGKAIGLGKIDLFVNLFMNSEQSSETGFRAVLNRDFALLFPRDVFMNGVFYSGNDFSLTTNFQMDPGDRNAPPYDTFAHTPNTDERGDKDYNGNGKLDVMNPFPFAVQREITLLGKMVNPDRLEGTYFEAIGNLLPGGQKIFIDGTFQLDRQTTAPTKRSVFNQTQTYSPVVPIGGSSGTPYRDRTITVSDSINIQNLVVTLNTTFGSSAVTVTLFGPNGQSVLLHPSGTALSATTVFRVSDFNNQSGMGNWTLRIGWNPATGERGYWNGWSLNIEGLATYSVSGTVVNDVGTPLAGAHVVLAGSNIIRQADTAADGTFSFGNLTESSYSVSLSKAGYVSTTYSFFLTNQDLVLDSQNLKLNPLVLPDAILTASPPIGAEPLFVEFNFLIPLAQVPSGATTTTWDFGDGTTVSDSATPHDAVANAIAVQSDGKIVVAGYSNASIQSFALVRYNPDGSLDTSFNGNGKVTTEISGGNAGATSLVLQSDGKILVAGISKNEPSDFALVRYNTNGTLDTSFNGTGKVTTDLGGSNDKAYSVALQSDGKIVVAGSIGFFNNSNLDFAVVRYNTNGSLDTSFNVTGKVTVNIGDFNDQANSVKVQSDGRIVVAGYVCRGPYDSSADYDFGVVRLNANGSLDASFDGDGKATVSIGTNTDFGQSMALQSDGKIVLAGSANLNTYIPNFAVVRYDSNGILDPFFGNGGKVTTAIGGSQDAGFSVAVQGDGKIVVAGLAVIDGNRNFALVRYNPDGSLDTNFNGSGKSTTAFGSGIYSRYSVALQSDGKIVVAGDTYIGNTPQFAVLRFTTNGSLDTGFGSGGKVSVDPALRNDVLPTTASHIYNTPGVFTATATISNGSATVSKSTQVHVLRTRPDAAGPAVQLVAGSFVGSLAAPLSAVGNPIQPSNQTTILSFDISNDGNPPLVNFQSAVLFQESKRDTAPFDIDRFPLLSAPSSFNPSGEDSDFDGIGTYTIYQQPKVQGVEVPDRWRVITTLGGGVFGEAPSRVGNFILQAGRVQP